MKRNTEVRLLIKILAIIGFAIMLVLLAGYLFLKIRVPQLLEFSEGIAEYRVTVHLDSLEGARFVTGMKGCENVLPVRDSAGVYVSCLDGYIHYLEQDDSGKYKISRSFKAGEAVAGLALSPSGNLYAAVSTSSPEEWITVGGAVHRISRDLSSKEKITGNFPAMNGICIDKDGNLYFASCNFNFLNPHGKVYRMNTLPGGTFDAPEAYIPEAGLANGLYFDPLQDVIFLANTTNGIYEFNSSDNTLKEVYLKLKFMEGSDDLCTDISGNVWITDPGQGTIKMFNPGTNRLARFNINGIGQASSCRIRSENGIEMLYITELKQSQNLRSNVFDGRGVLIVPAQSLLKFLEPILTDKL